MDVGYRGDSKKRVNIQYARTHWEDSVDVGYRGDSKKGVNIQYAWTNWEDSVDVGYRGDSKGSYHNIDVCQKAKVLSFGGEGVFLFFI